MKKLITLLLLFTSITCFSQDYVINTSGGTITATPRTGSGFTTYSGTDAYTVIQSAITALTVPGAVGSHGGYVHINSGYYSLSNELKIIGWEGGGSPYSQLILEGSGFSTTLNQSTAGKNGIVVNNNASVVIKNMVINVSSSTGLAAILLNDNGANSNESTRRSTFENLILQSNSTVSPTWVMKNFFDILANQVSVYSFNNTGISMQNTGSGIHFGNSHFGFIRCQGNAVSPYAAISITSASSNNYRMDFLSFDNIECLGGYYGLYANNFSNCNFNLIDFENNSVGISLNGSSNDGSNNNRFSGFCYGLAHSTAIQVDAHCIGNQFDNFTTGGDSTSVALSDQSVNGGNRYSLILGYYMKATNISITNRANTVLEYTDTRNNDLLNFRKH